MEKRKINKKIIILIFVIILMLGGITFAAYKAIVYTRTIQPLTHIANGLNNSDSRELMAAFPPSFSDNMTDNDFEKMDEIINDLAEYYEDDFLNDDDYKFKLKILGQEKMNSKKVEQFNEYYDILSDMMNSDINIDTKSIYYTDVKLTVKSSKDNISITVGVYLDKIDGKWYIISGDEIFNTVFMPNMVSYVNKSKSKMANSNAKVAYNVVSEYLSDQDQETSGYSKKSVFNNGDFAEANSVYGLNCMKSEPSADGDRVIYRAFSDYDNEDAGIVYVGFYEDDGQESVFVQWKASETSEIIGQYPNPIEYYNDGSVTWGEYYDW